MDPGRPRRGRRGASRASGADASSTGHGGDRMPETQAVASVGGHRRRAAWDGSRKPVRPDDHVRRPAAAAQERSGEAGSELSVRHGLRDGGRPPSALLPARRSGLEKGSRTSHEGGPDRALAGGGGDHARDRGGDSLSARELPPWRARLRPEGGEGGGGEGRAFREPERSRARGAKAAGGRRAAEGGHRRCGEAAPRDVPLAPAIRRR